MPFQSKSQRNFLHAKKPGIAKRWEEESKKSRGKKVAERRGKKKGTVLCEACGTKNPKTEVECKKCGAPLKKGKFAKKSSRETEAAPSENPFA